MDSEFSIIVDMVQTFGTWAIFLYLFVQERASHERTREDYRNDLRDIAGLRARIAQIYDEPETRSAQAVPVGFRPGISTPSRDRTTENPTKAQHAADNVRPLRESDSELRWQEVQRNKSLHFGTSFNR